jgi:hypothetical protein
VPQGNLTYVTDWSLSGLPGGGQSQRLTVSDSAGRVLKVQTLNRVAGSLSARIEGLSGDCILQAELYSQPNLAGVQTGLLRLPVLISGETSVQSTVGAAPASVKVLPETASVQVPASKKFYGVARDAAGIYTFHPQAGFQWQVLGGIGSVTQDGLGPRHIDFGSPEWCGNRDCLGPGHQEKQVDDSGLLERRK